MVLLLVGGDVPAAVETTRRRARLLDGQPVRADSGLEFSDGFNMATDMALAAGDLRAARAFAERVRSLPFYREEGYIGVARLIIVTALAGEWGLTVELAGRYRDGWERAGRPQDGDTNRCAYAAATVFGLRGDDPARQDWLSVVRDLLSQERLSQRDVRCYQTFDALLALHRGEHERAVQLLTVEPESCPSWHDGLWRPWHAALWAEAAVLSGARGARDRIARARRVAAPNPISTAVLDRSAALLDGDRDALLAAAADLEASGCRYQWARTLLLAGGADGERGAAELAAMAG
jgi:hypothetical protein